MLPIPPHAEGSAVLCTHATDPQFGEVTSVSVFVHRGAGWAAEMGVNHDQPFYSVLPDELDCVRLFKALRITKYVAQVSRLSVYDSYKRLQAVTVAAHDMVLGMCCFSCRAMALSSAVESMVNSIVISSNHVLGVLSSCIRCQGCPVAFSICLNSVSVVCVVS